MKALSLILAFASALPLAAEQTNPWLDHFTIENIPAPPEVDPQIGGITTLPNGNIAVTFHRGELYIYSVTEKTWSRFAEGLHEPLGIVAESDTSFLIGQRAEITRVADTDKDGVADSYENFFNDFGLSGNYHEFTFGPTRSADGSLYIGLGTASNYGMPFPEIRGEWSETGGFKLKDYIMPYEQWKTFRESGDVSRMYARVPYRGWVLKIADDGKSFKPFASGFRTPNGVLAGSNGKIYVSDNQGDWLGASKLFEVQEGKFHGHPDSLQWQEGWDTKMPHKMTPEELDKMRTREVALLPSGDLANSPTQIIETPGEEQFGIAANTLLMGEMNQKRLVRYIPDEVNGTKQGAAVGFIEGEEIGNGANRMAFDQQGSLVIGKTHLNWAGGEGLQKITWNKKPYLHIQSCKLTKDGFDIQFSHSANDTLKDASQLKISHYGLNYNAEYGSPKIAEKSPKITEIKWSTDGKTASILLDEKPVIHQVYDITFKDVSAKDIGKLLGSRIFYTTNAVY